jgi:hypothetical protein
MRELLAPSLPWGQAGDRRLKLRLWKWVRRQQQEQQRAAHTNGRMQGAPLTIVSYLSRARRAGRGKLEGDDRASQGGKGGGEGGERGEGKAPHRQTADAAKPDLTVFRPRSPFRAPLAWATNGFWTNT